MISVTPSETRRFTQIDRRQATALAASLGSSWSTHIERDSAGDESVRFFVAYEDAPTVAFTIDRDRAGLRVMDWRPLRMMGETRASEVGIFTSISSALTAIQHEVESWNRSLHMIARWVAERT